MRKLILYGDSFTEGHLLTHNFVRTIDWVKYLGGKLPPNWFEILSEKLNIPYVNHGYGGCSNDYIFERFCKTCHLINKNDIVILQWTYNDRFRWVDKITLPSGEIVDSWRGFSASFDRETIKKYMDVTTWENILINRTSILYRDLYMDYQRFIEHFAELKKFDLYIWAADESNVYTIGKDKLNQKKYICHNLLIPKLDELRSMGHRSALLNLIIQMGGQLIVDETDGNVLDGTHLGEKGHKIQAEIFYQYISSFENKLI